jgi:putative transcriptional regulator
MDSSLRARFARLGPIRAVDRETSGSPAVIVLHLTSGAPRPRTIDPILALARRGMTMLRAKRAIEALIEKGREFVQLPVVEDVNGLTADLAKAGIDAVWIQPDITIDVRGLRERLQLTREQFAVRYGLEVEILRNWETGKREPDTTARSYLRVIANAPEQLVLAYVGTRPS